VVGVRIPLKEINDFQKMFKHLLLNIPKVKPLREIEGDKLHKEMLLKEQSSDFEDFNKDKKYLVESN
jgi:hypothetical protein